MIYLPDVRPDDPWYRKIGIYLFNWIFWIVPAASDTLSGDVGPDYGREVALFTALAIAVIVIAFVAPNEKLGITNSMVAIGAVGAYLFIGILYHLSMRKWN